MSLKIARRVAGTVAMAGAALLLVADPGLAVSPSIGSNSGGANVRTCANKDTCASVAYLNNGTTVTMVCWTDGQTVSPPDSDYTSARWFKINSPANGFVHSSLIENQVSTPRCP